MDGLPTGWESDYDGSRWLYRYAPTGRIQFTFPKPGDEFPQFDTPGAGRIALTPEEQLAYELQLKWQKDGMHSQGSTIPRKGKVGTKDDNFGTKTASGYFDPSAFMYLGEGMDDGELTPIADAAPEYPNGFAELASSDTMLCAEELAPIELDAGPVMEEVPIAFVERVDEALTTAESSPPHPGPRPSVPLSGEPSTRASPAQEDDIYSATPVERPESQPPFVRDVPAHKIASSTNQATVNQAMPTTPRFAFTQNSPPIRSGDAKAAKPNVTGWPETREAPLGSPGRSVDGVQTVPVSLQPHGRNRARSEATDNPPWTPTIKFVQSGQIQESRVTVSPRASPGFLAERKMLASPIPSPGLLALQQPTQLNKVSEWLHRQSFVEPAADPSDTVVPSQASSELLPPVTLETVPHQVHDQNSASQGSPQPKPKKVERRPVPRSEQSSAPVAGRNSPSSGSPNKLHHGPEDKVVESIIEVPSASRVGGSRGVQLKDLIPSHARKIVTKGKAVRQRKKRFSWEEETGSSEGEMAKDTTPALKSGPKTPTRSPALARVSPRRKNVAMQHSPRASPVPSPSLLLNGHLSPGLAQRGVLVQHAVLEPCTASVETVPLEESFKPLPPLPLGKKTRTDEDSVLQQPHANAFEQISELIAVTNAAMPSARRVTAIEPEIPAVDDCHSPDKSTSRSVPSSAGQLTARPFPPPSPHQHLTVRPSHKRSVSQQDASVSGLKPPVRQHNRSQSMAAPFDPSTASSVPVDNDRSAPTPSAMTVVKPKVAQAVGTDGHKSHLRASIHLTVAGSFPYHPLRSSPVLEPVLEPVPTEELNNDASPSWNLDPQLTPKPTVASTSQTTKNTKRLSIQLKVPSYPGLPSSPRPSPRFQGLPSSPRPSPRFQPKLINRVAVVADDLNEQPKTSNRTTIEEPRGRVPGVGISNIATIVDNSNAGPNMDTVDTIEDIHFSRPGRRPSESTVSSPTSSIFSHLRDSSVSAMSTVSTSSSLVDSYFSPLADLTAEMVALEKNQARLVRQHRRAASTSPKKSSMEHDMPIKPAHMLALTSPPLFNSPTVSSPPKHASSQPSGVYTPVPRPKNIPEWIRPAGTPASPPLAIPKVQEVAPAPVRPSIPTVVIRAPTVRLRPPPRVSVGRKSSLVRPSPPISQTPCAVPEEVGVEEEAATLVGKPTQVVDVVKRPSPTVAALPVFEMVDVPPTPDDLLLGSPESILFDHVAITEVLQPIDLTPVPASTPTDVSPPVTVTPGLVETAPVIDTPPMLDTVDLTDSVVTSSTTDSMASSGSVFEKSPVTKVLLSMDAAQEEAASQGPQSNLQPIRNSEDSASSRPKSFLQSIRNSWRTSALNLPRPTLTAAPFNSHIRAKSQGNIPEQQGIMAEALAAAKKQQADAIAAWHQSGQDNDQWPARESVAVVEDSISNVGAAIRFFNASFSSLRPQSETDLEPIALPEDADVMTNAVTVVRRRGPPVVVRIPAVQT